jgi:hypothetical protein
MAYNLKDVVSLRTSKPGGRVLGQVVAPPAWGKNIPMGDGAWVKIISSNDDLRPVGEVMGVQGRDILGLIPDSAASKTRP